MEPTFTPRTTSRPTPTEQKELPATPAPSRSLWARWKPRMKRFVMWTLRLLKRLGVGLVRVVHRLSRTQRIRYGLVVLVIITGAIFFSQILSRPKPIAQTPVATTTNTAELPQETPGFTTMLPAGKSIDDYGGWTRVSPSDHNPVYAYPDTLADISIIVSEQPLPDEFKTDINQQIRTLAASYNAEHTFDAGGVTVYIGKSVKGPQSLIFTTRGLLILVKSSGTISDDRWKEYIRSLR